MDRDLEVEPSVGHERSARPGGVHGHPLALVQFGHPAGWLAVIEAEWNANLRIHADAVADYEKGGREGRTLLDAETRRRMLDLAEHFPQVWHDPRIDIRERKRILRLLVEDVTLVKAEAITVHVRLPGGATRTLTLDRLLPIAQSVNSDPNLSPRSTDCSISTAIARSQKSLTSADCRPGGKAFQLEKIAFIRSAYKLASRHQRLRARGMLTTREVADRFSVTESAVHKWGQQGLIQKCCSDNLYRGLWEVPPDQTVLKGCGGRGARPARLSPISGPLSGEGAV